MITKLPSFKRPVSRAALFTCLFATASAFALPQVATPTFSPAGGVYTSAQSVTITSATSGASIAYTTDNTIPTESGGVVTHGTLYSGAITVSTTTLSAVAFEPGYLDSAVAIDGYTLQAAGAPASGTGVFTPLVVTSPTLNVLYSFSTVGTGGINPAAALVQGTDGNFYGTTTQGASGNAGTVFKVTSAGIFTTLVQFNSTDGANPRAALVQGTDGNFYGTTEFGGSGVHNGTVFQMTPAGTLTTLVFFTGTNGLEPVAPLVQGTDGNFYGTTSEGGSGSGGIVFKMTSTGTLTSLVQFNSTTGGSLPEAGLVQGSDGNFYGTTVLDDGFTTGTFFKLTSAGVLTAFSPFNTANGFSSQSALVQGLDGNFYGTAYSGGSSSDISLSGTVFRITPAGVLTTLVSFTGANGASPSSALVQGSDGNFYGTTSLGGASSDGTIFQMTPSGTLITLVSFNGANGAFPSAGLVLGSDGNLYGTTFSGGASNDGVVFQLMVPPAAAAPVFSPGAGTYTSAQTVTITSATSGASIRYTTDGSTPTETAGTLYSGPFSVSTTATLSAIAFKSGLADSAVITLAYTIQGSGAGGSTGSTGGTVVHHTIPASSGGGGAPSWWFLGFLASAGILRWKFCKTRTRGI
jgi:uncharacterized repeat protein (TIGR03803 family)